MLMQMTEFPSFLQLSDILLHVYNHIYVYHIFFIHSPSDRHLTFYYFSLWFITEY